MIPVYGELGLELPDDSAQDRKGRTKLDRFVSATMVFARKVIIAPDRTNRGLKMHKLGSENSRSGKRLKLGNAMRNPKNNKKNSKKRKEENDEATRDFLMNHPTLSESVLQKGEAEVEAMRIFKVKFEELGKQSISISMRAPHMRTFGPSRRTKNITTHRTTMTNTPPPVRLQ